MPITSPAVPPVPPIGEACMIMSIGWLDIGCFRLSVED
jgi:hypothetical protein